MHGEEDRVEADSGFLLLNQKQGVKDVQRSIDALRVKTPTSATRIESLSGGNQQKVLFARWLLVEPEILILDEPTRGIDVGAKYEIYKLMNRLAESGFAIIMISSELEEVLGMSDRVMVMWEGRSNGILEIAAASQEKIMARATGIEVAAG